VSDGGGTGAVAPLSVATDLTVTIDGAAARIESTGERLLVGFGSIPEAFRGLRGLPAGAEDSVAAVLTTTDLTVEVRVRDRTVAVGGADARPGALSRSLGVAPFEVRLGGVLGAVGAEVGAARRALSRLRR
jgi:hypothetical protein